jgi:hypothetical protein
VNREPNFDDLVGTETRGAERERLRGAHELLLRAGPPAELPPKLEKAPSMDVVRLKPRRTGKRRALILIAAAVLVGAVFGAGYGIGNNRGGSTSRTDGIVKTLSLKGTSQAPNAQATLDVWRPEGDNWPMTLHVMGLPKNARYEVYLVRNGRPWGACGTFVTTNSSGPLTLRLNAPYVLKPGDSWVVTRPGAAGAEPGRTVLRPVSV